MSVHSVPDAPDTYYVDTPMFGMNEVNSPYILDTPEPAIVDTGTADAPSAIFDALDALDIPLDSVSSIIPTHAHLDHAGGAGYLAEQCENATVYCHERGIEYLTDESKLEQLTASVERAIGMEAPYGEPQLIDPERCETLTGGGELSVGDRTLEVIDAPGHAPHQYCLYDTETTMLFSADANGMNFPDVDHRPTTPPPNFDLDAAIETLDALRALEPDTLLYAHYGPGEGGRGIEELERYREMLPAFVDRIDRLADEHGGEVAAIARELREDWEHWSLTTDIAGVLRYLDTR